MIYTCIYYHQRVNISSRFSVCTNYISFIRSPHFNPYITLVYSCDNSHYHVNKPLISKVNKLLTVEPSANIIDSDDRLCTQKIVAINEQDKCLLAVKPETPLN